MNINQKEIGQRIKKTRKEHKLSQEQTAEILNISYCHYAKIESGAHGLSIDLLVEIAAYFDVTTDYILLGKAGTSPMLRSVLKSAIQNLTELEKML